MAGPGRGGAARRRRRPPALSRTPAPALPDRDCSESYADDGAARRAAAALRNRAAARRRGGRRPDACRWCRERRPRATPRLLALRGQPRTRFAVRLNRLFMADGARGHRAFQAARPPLHERTGIEVELQVRYHPRPADDGNLARWLAFVRRVVRAFGPNRLVTGLQITNEVNLTFSPNTSDGCVPARGRGAGPGRDRGQARLAAARLRPPADRLQLRLALRPARATPPSGAGGPPRRRRLRRHTDWVGLDIYPGTYAPGLLLHARVDAGDALLEGLAQTRECFMPLAGFGRRTPLRIEEMGVTRPGPGPQRGRAAAPARRARAHGPRLSRRLRPHRPALVQPARQQLRGARLAVPLRAAARRLHAQARLRRVPPV